ncbi:MAG: 7-cyano-7-deazaguanine synthase, partial [Candidatus Thermoplasmatota archaeon]|nr:7-cyano-7-deazaguanine synthase [Candidatus Thermoplasmatota archaeon]
MFSPEAFIEEAVEALRKEIPGKAVIAVSGGVDSTTAAVLASRALGKNLRAVYVDTGLMRKGEREDVDATLQSLGVSYEVLEAADRFFGDLKGVVDPEKKRKAIGNTFVRLFEEEARKVGAEWLIQGTIAPDWIESGGQLRDRIKTHHNVAGLPTSMTLEVVEPLRDLYKDEVRRVARALGVQVAE